MGIQERKEREKEQRREEILNAAQSVFFEKGLQNATMDEIAESAELSKGTLYLYYASKEDLYLAVTLRGMDILRAMFEESIARNTSTIETVFALGRTYFEFFQTHTNYFRMFHFFQNPSLHRQVSENMMASCNEGTQQLWAVVIDVFRRGIQEGVLRSDMSPEELAVILWSSANAILTRIDYEYENWKKRLNVDLVKVLFKSNALLIQAMVSEQTKEKYGHLFETENTPQLL